jgi:hypothetical protein
MGKGERQRAKGNVNGEWGMGNRKWGISNIIMNFLQPIFK